jgi:hypothetical protein
MLKNGSDVMGHVIPIRAHPLEVEARSISLLTIFSLNLRFESEENEKGEIGKFMLGRKTNINDVTIERAKSG